MGLDWGLSARLLIFGGVAFALLFTLFSLGSAEALPAGNTFFDDYHWFAHLCEAIAMGPLAVGIVGLYSRYAEHLGRLGRVGVYVAAGGLGAEAVAGLLIAVGEPLTGVDTMTGVLQGLTHGPGVLGNFLGGLLFGLAMLRSAAVPRHAAVPFMALAVVATLAMFAPISEALRLFLPAVIALGWAWLGIAHLKVQPRPEVALEYSYD